MIGLTLRVVVGVAIVAGMAWLLVVPAQASAKGPCWAAGYASRVPGTAIGIVDRGHRADADVSTADLTTIRTWRVPVGDTVVAEASASTPQRITMAVVLFGVRVPVPVVGAGSATTVYTDALSTSQVSLFARRFGLEARADACQGAIVFETGGAPLLSVAGSVGLLLSFVGLFVLMVVALGRSPAANGVARVRRWMAGTAAGALAGIGAGLWLQEAGPLSPLDRRALLLPIAGLVLGALAATAAARRPPQATSGVPTAAPPLALGLALLILGAGFAPVGSDPSALVLTTAQARAIALQTWAVARQAHSSHDTAPLEAHFAAQGLEWARIRSQGTEDYAQSMMAHPVHVASITIARKVEYPAYFLVNARADTRTSSDLSGTRIFFVFTRATPATGWVASAVDEEPIATEPPRFARDDQGYAPEPNSSELDHLVMRPEQAAPAYTAFLTRSVAAGAPATTSPFAPGRYTSDAVNANVAYVQRKSQEHVRTTLTYRSLSALALFTYDHGAALVLATFARDDTGTSIGGGCVSVTTHPDDRYRQVTFVATGVVLLEIPPRTAKDRSITVLGHDVYYSRTEYGSTC